MRCVVDLLRWSRRRKSMSDDDSARRHSCTRISFRVYLQNLLLVFLSALTNFLLIKRNICNQHQQRLFPCARYDVMKSRGSFCRFWTRNIFRSITRIVSDSRHSTHNDPRRLNCVGTILKFAGDIFGVALPKFREKEKKRERPVYKYHPAASSREVWKSSDCRLREGGEKRIREEGGGRGGRREAGQSFKERQHIPEIEFGDTNVREFSPTERDASV